MTTSTIKVKVVRRPHLKLKVYPKFPATVLATSFVTLTGSGATYTLGVDYTVLPAGPITDPTTAFVAIQDKTSGIYRTVTLASLLTSGLDQDLQVIAALTGSGILARTGTNTWALRAVTGTANEITVTNGDGVAGAPTLSLPAALTFTGKTVTGGTFNSPALVTPALGTPASGVATNLTGTASGLTAGNVTTNANLTGPVTSVGNATAVTANAITNAMMATMGANTVKANATGGSAAPTDVAPATARSSSLLNVDSFTGRGDSNYTILATDRTVGTNAAFTASRTWTLPAANAVNPGQEIVIADFQGTVTGTNTLVISRAGADTINGATTATIAAANAGLLLRSDGVSKWTAQAFTAGTGITSITAGTGLSGGTITTSGTIAVNLTTASNVLGADVALNNTGLYFDGPSMAQGTSGTWFVSGTVTVLDTANVTAGMNCKLWDGTTVIASTRQITPGVAGIPATITLSGIITSPAANIRMSCQDISGATGVIKFNSSGNSKDSSIYGVRIA